MPAPWRAAAAFGIAAAYFAHEFVQRVSTSVVVGDLMAAFSVGGAVLGSLSAFYFYAYAGMQIPVGVLMDRFGPRRLMCAAAAVSTAGTVIFASAPAIEFAYLGRAMIGLGASFSWIGILTVTSLWLPPARFSGLAGVAQAAGMAGAVFGQAPLSLLVGELGWRWAVGVLAGVGGTICVSMFLLIPNAPPKPAQHAAMRLTEGLRIAAANKQTWLNAAFGLSMTGTMLAFAGLWAVPWLETVRGFGRAEAAGLASSMFVGWAVGSPLIGWLSDRAKRRKIFMIGCGAGMTATLLAVLYAALPGWLLGAAMFVNGVFASGMILAYANARDHNPPGAGGATYGIVNTGVVGSGAIFQPLLGWLLDLNWHGAMNAGARVYDAQAYGIAFAALPAVAVAGTVAAMLAAEAKRP